MMRNKRLVPNREKLNHPWRYTAVDAQILTYLARYRYLRGTTLHALIGGRPDRVNYSLRKLFDRRLIDKPRSQALGYNSLNDTDIYEINQKGQGKLIETVPEATNLIRAYSDAPIKQFSHMMMICDALSSIEIGTKGSEVTFIAQDEILAKVTHEHPLKLPCHLRFTFKNGATHRGDTFIIPDGVFGLRYPNGQTRLFLLEAEHYNPLYPTNLNRASFLKKVIAYTDIKAKKTIKQLGKSSFTVLFVFPTATRARNAALVVEEVLGRSDLLLMTNQPVQEEIWRSPHPAPELFTGTWLRGGMEPVSIKETPTA
jgi:hypothetical protein